MTSKVVYRIYNDSRGFAGLQEWWTEQVREDLNNGANDIGVLGETYMIVQDTAENEDKALARVRETAVPYCGAVCVPFKGTIGGKPQSVLWAEQSHEQKAKRLEKVKEDLHKWIQSQPKKTIGCKNCGSSIMRGFLKDFFCPVCGVCILYPSYKKDLDTAIEAVEKAAQKLPPPGKTWESRPGTCYVIGGWNG